VLARAPPGIKSRTSCSIAGAARRAASAAFTFFFLCVRQSAHKASRRECSTRCRCARRDTHSLICRQRYTDKCLLGQWQKGPQQCLGPVIRGGVGKLALDEGRQNRRACLQVSMRTHRTARSRTASRTAKRSEHRRLHAQQSADSLTWNWSCCSAETVPSARMLSTASKTVGGRYCTTGLFEASDCSMLQTHGAVLQSSV
jgi:hypothetical protein